jgi:hypothetical protein
MVMTRGAVTILIPTCVAVLIPVLLGSAVIAVLVAVLVARLIPILITALVAALIPDMLTRREILVPLSVRLLALALGLITLGLAVAVLPLLLFTALVNLTLGFGQKAQVMFGVLLEVFHRNAIIAQLRVTGELIVFVDDLLRSTAHFAFGTRTVEDAVYDVSDTAVRSIVAARLARPGFG